MCAPSNKHQQWNPWEHVNTIAISNSVNRHQHLIWLQASELWHSLLECCVHVVMCFGWCNLLLLVDLLSVDSRETFGFYDIIKHTHTHKYSRMSKKQEQSLYCHCRCVIINAHRTFYLNCGYRKTFCLIFTTHILAYSTQACHTLSSQYSHTEMSIAGKLLLVDESMLRIGTAPAPIVWLKPIFTMRNSSWMKI